VSLHQVRRWHSSLEEIEVEGGRRIAPPLRRVVVAAVVTNPFAGRFEDDLTELIDLGELLSVELTARATALLGQPVTSYGKAGIVGTTGELEHLSAVLHPKFGQPLRKAVGGEAILQSTKKRGGPGVTIDIPLSHILEMRIRSHFDATTFMVPDAPLPHEMVICLAVAGGERAHQRVGGLTVAEAAGAAAAAGKRTGEGS
jgi:hypothetical protein